MTGSAGCLDTCISAAAAVSIPTPDRSTCLINYESPNEVNELPLMTGWQRQAEMVGDIEGPRKRLLS